MTDSPSDTECLSRDADRGWAALEAGLKQPELPDFDASLFDDGPGPWVILKGSCSDGPDPDDVFTVPTSQDRIVQGLKSVRAAHATAESWSDVGPNANRSDPNPQVLAYFSLDSAIYETMRLHAPIAELSMPEGTSISQLAEELTEIISAAHEIHDAATAGPRS